MSRNAFRAASLAAIAAFLLLLVPLAWAGTTGTLRGRVVGDKGEPLVGVNIRLEGQRLGALTDDQGNFIIVGIPAGAYVVHANLLGYAPYTADNVSIPPDFTSNLNVTLRTQAVQLQEVRVEAERPLLQRDATGTTRFLNSQDIQKLPTRGYRDAAANQTGVVNFQRQIDRETQNNNTLIVRGGRPNETAYFVDGFSQQDPLTGNSTTSISNNAIEEVVLKTGGFEPEYGRIMSGAVNVITREGRKNYFGALEAVTDALSGAWVKAPVTDYNIYDGSIGGPVLPGNDKLTFYVSGERRWQRDRQPTFMPAPFIGQLKEFGMDPDFKPNNQTSGWTFQGKVAWQPTDRMTLKVGGLGSQDKWREYVNTYLFNLPHSPRYLDNNQSYFATLNNVVNTKTFWSLGGNFFQTLRKRGDGVAFDNLTQYIIDSNPTYYGNGSIPMFWDAGHIFDDYLQRKSSYWGLQGQLTSQIDRHNQVKFGGDFQRHTLRFFEHYFPVQLGTPNVDDYDAYGYTLVVDQDPSGTVTGVHVKEGGTGQDGPKHPQTWSAYAQDKYEQSGVILNGGLRFDHINVDTPALKNPLLPLGDPDDPNNLPDSLEAKDLAQNKTYSRLSPRLGVAFPTDEKTILRFNYGQFYQQPNLQDLYVSYRFLQHKVRTGGYFVGFGDPNLRPERTTAYEFGVQRLLGDKMRVDVTAYYKDVKDLVSIVTIPSFPNNYSSYRNTDFATIKGVDVGFTMRPIAHFSGNIAYSLSFAQGTGSVSLSHSNIAWTASNQPKMTAPLDFDQRHKLSLNLDWRLGSGEGMAIGPGGFRPFQNTGINVLFNVASGTPYTPTFVFNEVTLANVASQPSGPINSSYGPWTSNLDLKATKNMGFGQMHLEAFVWVLNLFDNRNATRVYNSSGSPLTTNFESTADYQQYLQTASDNGYDGAALYNLAEQNPTNFSNPRLVRFGVRTAF